MSADNSMSVSSVSPGWDFSTDGRLENFKKESGISRKVSRPEGPSAQSTKPVIQNNAEISLDVYSFGDQRFRLFQPRIIRRYTFDGTTGNKLPSIKHFDLRLTPRTNISGSTSSQVTALCDFNHFELSLRIKHNLVCFNRQL